MLKKNKTQKTRFKISLLLVFLTIAVTHGLFNVCAFAKNDKQLENAMEQLINKDFAGAEKLFNLNLKDSNIDVDDNLKALLHEPFFVNDDIVGRNAVSIEELEYIRKVAVYKKLADSVTKGIDSEREIVFALFDWVVRNIAINCGKKETNIGKETTAFPYDYMLRGFGGCDRSSWVLATLASQAGFHANNIALPNHSMTQIYVENGWALFDPFYNVIFMNDGKLLGLDDLSELKGVINSNDSYMRKEQIFDDLKQCRIEIICDPFSLLPKIKNLDGLLKENYDIAPNIYYDILEELSFTISSMSEEDIVEDGIVSIPHKIDGTMHNVYISMYPFVERITYTFGKYSNNIERNYPYLKYFAAAREFQISGAYLKAINEYERLMALPAHKDIKDKLIYNQALCFYEINNLSAAKKLFKRFRKEYPDSEELNGVDHHLKLINKRLNGSEIKPHKLKKESKGVQVAEGKYCSIKKQILINVNDPIYKSALYDGYNDLGKSYAKSGRFDDAILNYKKALRVNPELLTAYYYLSSTYINLRELDKAINELLKALLIAPDDSDAHYLLCIAYYNKKDFQNSKFHCDKAVLFGEKVSPKLIDKIAKKLAG